MPDLAKKAPDPITNLSAVLDSKMQELKSTLAGRINPDVFKRFVLTDLRRNPKLAQCSQASLVGCVVTASQFALLPGTKQIYFVPFGNEATPIIGYAGLIELAKRGGQIKKIEARVVHEKDEFDYQYGTDPKIIHVPSTEVDPGPMTHVYAIAFMADKDTQFDVMSKSEVDSIRKRSRAANSGPWVTDYESMSRKTVVRRISSMLSLDLFPPAVIEQLNREDEAEFVKPADATVIEPGRRKIGQRKAEPVAEPVAVDTEVQTVEAEPIKPGPKPKNDVEGLKKQLKESLKMWTPEGASDLLFSLGIDSLEECKDAHKIAQALETAQNTLPR